MSVAQRLASLVDYCVRILEHEPTGLLLSGDRNHVILLAGLILQIPDTMCRSPAYQSWMVLMQLELDTSRVVLTKSWRGKDLENSMLGVIARGIFDFQVSSFK